MSSLAKRQEWDSFSTLLIQSVRIIALITIPITFFSFITGENIITLVYKSNSFDDESVMLTLEAFRYHIIGLFFIAVNRIISPAFYAQGNTKSPVVAGIIGFAVNILLALVLVTPMAGGGIALALTLASLANTVFLFVFLAKTKTVSVAVVVKDMILYSLKLVVYSIIASLPLILFHNQIFSLIQSNNRFIREGGTLTVAALIFAFIGVALLLLTKDPVVKVVMDKIKRK